MRLPTRVIREWKTVRATDGEEIVWIAVLDNGEFALCVELPEQIKPVDPEVWEMLNRRNGQQHQDEAFADPEVDDLTTDEQGHGADERFRRERDEMRRIHERGQQ